MQPRSGSHTASVSSLASIGGNVCTVLGPVSGTQGHTAGAAAVSSTYRTHVVTLTAEPPFSSGAIQGHPLASRNFKVSESLKEPGGSKFPSL